MSRHYHRDFPCVQFKENDDYWTMATAVDFDCDWPWTKLSSWGHTESGVVSDIPTKLTKFLNVLTWKHHFHLLLSLLISYISTNVQRSPIRV